MKICAVQSNPVKGDISANINSHLKLIRLAIDNCADAVFFPELSLTGYEPSLAKALAVRKEDQRLSAFQKVSDHHHLTVGVGIPVNADGEIQIGMAIFQPAKNRQIYSKQQLHTDELPYFVAGKEQIILDICNKKVAPAICYESLQFNHARKAYELGAEIYIASVAKSQKGLDKAISYYPTIAKKYAMPVLMANTVDYCDDFISIGSSAVWTKDGNIKAQLDTKKEGL